MHRYRVVGVGHEGLLVPGGPPLEEGEPVCAGQGVVGGEVEAARVEGEAGDEPPAVHQMGAREPRTAALGARGEEDHDVARGDDGVEGPAELEGGQVGLEPLEFGSLVARPGQHGGVEVHAEHLDPAPGQLDRHPPGAAPGVEDRSRPETGDEVASPWMSWPLCASSLQRRS